MKDLILPPLNSLLTAKIEPRLMKDTYKKVHIYLFDFDLMLGKGSFSKVYKGINLNTNEQVAVKVVETTSITTPKLKQLLLQQIDILMKIKNDNLIKCFEVLSSAKNTYIVMELCTYDFGTICDYVQKHSEIEKSPGIEKHTQYFNTPFLHPTHGTPKSSQQKKRPGSSDASSVTKSINSISSTKSVEIQETAEEIESRTNEFGIQAIQNLKEITFYPFIKQIFQGLQYLQNQRIVHRDLKLSNIFLTASKACKIGDFGFATIIPTNEIEIKDTCCIGSPLYMSPQSYIENVYSLKSDIWSFGILIFQMMYGNPPHWNCPTHDILKSQIRKPIDLKKFQRLCKISDELKEVLEGCLQVDVRKRFSITELKETKLFKRLFYQPLESKVIVSSRQKQEIDESSVEIFGTSNTRNDSIRGEYKEIEYNNYSTIEKVKEGSIDSLGYKINRLSKGEQLNPARKYQNSQNFVPMANCSNPFYERMENNSFTDRANETEMKLQKRASTSTKLENYNLKYEDLSEGKYRSTELNGNSFREAYLTPQKKRNSSQLKQKPAEQKQFLYKNSEEMQKFLKEMKENRGTSCGKNSPNVLVDGSVTFTDLSNIMSHSKNESEQKRKTVDESPKFSTFNGSFFNSGKYEKVQKAYEKRKSTEINNHSMLENLIKKPTKPTTSYSPRNNDSSFIEENKADLSMNERSKDVSKEDGFTHKNYSTINFPTSSKHYSIAKEPEKYEYKSKILDKCISTPKFENHQADQARKNETEEERSRKYMTASTFLGSANQARSPRVKNPSASNIIKDYNLKDEIQSKTPTYRKTEGLIPKSFDGTSNYLFQFSTKNKEQSQIQKKTYWKANNSKNFLSGQFQKTLDSSKNDLSMEPMSPIHSNQTRTNSNFFIETTKDQEDYQNSGNKRQEDQLGMGFPIQSFKLLNGELIIQDACEIVHFSRLLHKLSFMTENNSNSILLLQYSIQILRNLQQKCDNFEIKYHYDSSTNNSLEIREAFKSNEIYLNNLLSINEKECYAIKRECPPVTKPNSIVCNKTIQFKGIVDSYIKKYLQRKEALIKLFECNVLFENLTNKVKEAKQSIHNSKGETPALRKRASMNCERGFLNFTRLKKAIEEIEMEFRNKKEAEKSKIMNALKNQLQQGGVGNILLLKTADAYIQAIQKCVEDHSFMRLIEWAVSIMSSSQERMEWDFRHNNEANKYRSVIERLLEGCSTENKSGLKSPSSNDGEESFGKNYSVMVGASSFKCT